jgi:hypothetical protein
MKGAWPDRIQHPQCQVLAGCIAWLKYILDRGSLRDSRGKRAPFFGWMLGACVFVIHPLPCPLVQSGPCLLILSEDECRAHQLMWLVPPRQVTPTGFKWGALMCSSQGVCLAHLMLVVLLWAACGISVG